MKNDARNIIQVKEKRLYKKIRLKFQYQGQKSKNLFVVKLKAINYYKELIFYLSSYTRSLIFNSKIQAL